MLTFSIKTTPKRKQMNHDIQAVHDLHVQAGLDWLTSVTYESLTVCQVITSTSCTVRLNYFAA